MGTSRPVSSGSLQIFGSSAHVVEFYRTGDPRIGNGAARFLSEALRAGGIALGFATPQLGRGLVRQLERLGHDVAALQDAGRIVLGDSSGTLSRLIKRHAVVPEAFSEIAGGAVRAALERSGGAPVHAFGDMVGMLWQRDERDLAIDLERRWERLQEELPFALYCAYPIDVFGRDFSSHALGDVLAAHTHVSSSPGSAEFGRALDRALDDALGPEAALRLRSANREASTQHGPLMPQLERLILWLRAQYPDAADRVMQRARGYYEENTQRLYLR